MNEPLNNSRQGISFTGKTYNRHPQWYNQPLRLTEEQLKDPLPVLDEFFQCYHLNEIRQILWEWFAEVVSSHRSISIESLDRSNHLYFYEKIEEIIEAAFIIKKRIHKNRRRKEKQKLQKNVHSESNQDSKPKNDISTIGKLADFEFVEKEKILNKPKQLIEFVHDAPIFAIGEVFKDECLPALLNHLRNWLHVALSDDSSIYEDGEQRRQLITFHEELLLLVEALFVIYTQNIDDENKKEKIAAVNKITLFCQDQIANPINVIAAFYEKFPIAYIFRELNDWLEAGISFPGPYPESMSELQALHTYRNVLCLLKSAERLLPK